MASNVPGTPLPLGDSIRSVVDRNTKKRDVYAVSLSAGQEVRLSVVALANGGFRAVLVNPGARDLDGAYTKGFEETMYEGNKKVFTPAVSGTYSLVFEANQTGQAYTFSLALTPQ